MLAAKFVAASVVCETVPTEVTDRPSVVIVLMTKDDHWRCGSPQSGTATGSPGLRGVLAAGAVGLQSADKGRPLRADLEDEGVVAYKFRKGEDIQS